jgi:hypothetical protein
MKKAALLILWIIFVANLPFSAAGANPIFIEDGKGDFTVMSGSAVKQPFLDIRNVTVDYDGPSDKILLTIGFYAHLPSGGPLDSTQGGSDYYYSCSFRTGQNATLDQTTVVLENGGNWSSAYLQTYVRGTSFTGSLSPVKYRTNVDSIIFLIPAYISSWGERPKELLIMAESGYESFSGNGTSVEAAYFDRAPEEGVINFEVPPAPINFIPIIVLLGVLVLITAATWRLFQKRGGHSRKNK